jgi:putative hydrolase of the HAD superfamily
MSGAPVWLFDMDDTLHDASWQVFPAMRYEMTAYIERHLGVGRTEADRLRLRFWARYGATLIGLVREHGVDPVHFLAETHRFPTLPELLRADAHQRAAIRRLPGRKLVLTNAPRIYALRVLRELRLLRLFDGVLSIEDMHQFRQLRPKPDARMLRHLLRRHGLRPQQCVMIEDSLEHLRAARRIGLRGVWFTRYTESARGHGCPAYVHARMASLWKLTQSIKR